DAAGAALARAVGESRTLAALTLRDNGLGAGTGAALAKAVTVQWRHGRVVRPCRLTALDLSDNPGIGDAAGQQLLAALANDVTERLDLSRTGLGPEAGVVLGKKLLKSPTAALREVRLLGNSLGREGANEILWAMRLNRRVSVLDLSANGIGPHRLRLEGNALDDAAAGSIAAKLAGDCQLEALQRNRALTELDLSDNRLGPSGGNALAAALPRNGTLKRLGLENNRFDRGVGEAMVSALAVAAAGGNAGLVELRLSVAEVGIDAHSEIAAALADRQRAAAL
ncbi:unnamed protein product, partial [Phaeothamnion confervicola]